MGMSIKEVLNELAGLEGVTFGFDSAVKSLRPNARFTMSADKFVYWNDTSGARPPSVKEIEEEMVRLEKIAKHYEYFFKRAGEYPPGYEQLDMLWHDINSGKSLKDGVWFNTIREIREKYPKTDTPFSE